MILNCRNSTPFIFILMSLSLSVWSQTDSINVNSDRLNLKNIQSESSSFVVYMQDSLSGYKYNFEIWDRNIEFDSDDGYEMTWKRNNSEHGHFSVYTIRMDSNFAPISETVRHERQEDKESIVDQVYYSYQDNRMVTSSDTNLHRGEFFEMSGVAGAFNWEVDMEILALLSWENKNEYFIKFYHPGSKSPPSYYKYSFVETTTLDFNGMSYTCAIVRIQHGSNQSTLFWIDTKNHRTLQVRDYFFGRYRFKKRMI